MGKRCWLSTLFMPYSSDNVVYVGWSVDLYHTVISIQLIRWASFNRRLIQMRICKIVIKIILKTTLNIGSEWVWWDICPTAWVGTDGSSSFGGCCRTAELILFQILFFTSAFLSSTVNPIDFVDSYFVFLSLHRVGQSEEVAQVESWAPDVSYGTQLSSKLHAGVITDSIWYLAM